MTETKYETWMYLGDHTTPSYVEAIAPPHCCMEDVKSPASYVELSLPRNPVGHTPSSVEGSTAKQSVLHIGSRNLKGGCCHFSKKKSFWTTLPRVHCSQRTWQPTPSITDCHIHNHQFSYHAHLFYIAHNHSNTI